MSSTQQKSGQTGLNKEQFGQQGSSEQSMPKKFDHLIGFTKE